MRPRHKRWHSVATVSAKVRSPHVWIPARYGLTKSEARDIIDNQTDVIERDLSEVPDLVRLPEALRNFLWRRQILNAFAGYGY